MADFGMATVKETWDALISEGLGVGLGFIAAGALGRLVQNRWVTDADVTADPGLKTYAEAWAGNNLPKLAVWHFSRPYANTEFLQDVRKAFLGNTVFDSGMRLANQGTNPATAMIGTTEVLGNGSDLGGGVKANLPPDVQHILQENEALRNEVNKMQREMGLDTEALPDGGARRKRFGAMTAQEKAALQAAQTERQRKYAFMRGFRDSGVPDLTAHFGML